MATPPPTNAAPFTLTELVSLTGARVVHEGSRVIRGVSTDTRTLTKDNLFVALTGDRFDGHRFLERAISLGAGALLVSDASALDGLDTRDVSVVIASDTLSALGALGRGHRERMEREGSLRLLVAITGSVGKTTTKEMCAAALEALGHRTLRTAGNLNNRIGVPLTLLALEPTHDAAVIEVGMNVPGEIEILAQLARPHVGIVTAVAAVHTEGVGSIEGVAREKASLLSALSPIPGCVSAAIFTVDDRIVVPLARSSRASTHLGVGRHEDADVRLLSRHVRTDGASECRYAIRPPEGATSTDVELSLRLFGEGAARNAACALALAIVVGGTRALGPVAEALSALRAGEGRGALLAGLDGTLVIDDAYNASRRSVVNALEAASELAKARQGRVIAVLGDRVNVLYRYIPFRTPSWRDDHRDAAHVRARAVVHPRAASEADRPGRPQGGPRDAPRPRRARPRWAARSSSSPCSSPRCSGRPDEPVRAGDDAVTAATASSATSTTTSRSSARTPAASRGATSSSVSSASAARRAATRSLGNEGLPRTGTRDQARHSRSRSSRSRRGLASCCRSGLRAVRRRSSSSRPRTR
jgi:UDP-N-acetylmuramoyl-tripeptide--D-alanyl-D-alanine ligase